MAVLIVRLPSTKTALLTLMLAILVASLNLSSSGQLATVWLLVAGGYWLLARFLDEASLIITAVVAFVLVVVMDWSRGHTAFLTWILTMGLAMLLDWQMSRQRSQKLRIR